MKKQLELKHLAPYLPYGLIIAEIVSRLDPHNLKVIHYDRGEFLSYLGVVRPYIVWKCVYQHSGYEYIRETFLDEVGIKSIKPILRPLSDLTKEIEIGGVMDVPVEWLEEKYYTLDLHKQAMRLVEDTPDWIYHLDYLLIQHLLEWHFDVFGLIDAGLAIDSNTLEPRVSD